MMDRLLDYIGPIKMLSFIFIMVILLPISDSVFHFLPVNVNYEKKASKRSSFNIHEISNFTSSFQEHFNENFNGRTKLFYAYSKLKVYFFSNSPLPEHVILGKDNWLYYSIGKAENDWRGISCISKEKLEKIRSNSREIQSWFSKRNIKFYQVVVPDKDKIYPEYLAANIKIVDSIFNVDQITAFLGGENSLIYLKDTLLAQKKLGKLYFKSDHHWNKLGAFIGYSYLVRKLKKDFPILSPKLFEDYVLQKQKKGGGDLAYMLGLPEEYKEPAPFLKPKFASDIVNINNCIEVPHYFNNNPDYYAISKGNRNKNLPKVLVFRDSFASAMIPYLQENFRESLFIWDWHLDRQIIESEKPDIVIRMTVERNIDALQEGIIN